MDLKTSNLATYIFRFANEKMWKRGIVMTIVCMCVILQVRNFNRYRVERRRKHKEAATYLNSDVCADPITRSELGNFNLCEKAEHIVNERPTEAAFQTVDCFFCSVLAGGDSAKIRFFSTWSTIFSS